MRRMIGFAYGLLAYLIFFGTFLYLVGFLANVLVPKGIDDGTVLPTTYALLINAGLMALFGLQHSVMARPAFKKRIEHIIPASYERSTYVLAASLVLGLLLWQWKPMTHVLWNVDNPLLAGGIMGLYVAGFLLVLLSTFVIDHFDLFGLSQVTASLLRRHHQHPPFRVTFFYKFVRHPLYLGFLVAFWATPNMTVGRFVFAVGMTAYILIAVRYEERDLERFLGDDYRRYRERVPMLLPRPDKVHETIKPPASGHASGPA